MSENIIQSIGWQRLANEGIEPDANPLSRLIHFCDVGKIDQHLSTYLNEIASDFEKLRKLNSTLDANLIDKRDECKALEAENTRLKALVNELTDKHNHKELPY